MLKTLGRETKGFRLVSVLTPIFMIAEVIMEMIIPKLMASIIDNGVTPGNMQVIYTVGAQMVVAALFGLLFGVPGFFLLCFFEDCAEVINRRTIVKIQGIEDRRQTGAPVSKSSGFISPIIADILRIPVFFTSKSIEDKSGDFRPFLRRVVRVPFRGKPLYDIRPDIFGGFLAIGSQHYKHPPFLFPYKLFFQCDFKISAPAFNFTNLAIFDSIKENGTGNSGKRTSEIIQIDAPRCYL